MIISTRVELASDYIQIILICLAKIPSRNRNRFMLHCLRWLVLDIIDDENLMSNHERGKKRPTYFTIKDKDILWFIPLSSKVEKYKKIIDYKIKKYGLCDSILIEKVFNKETAILLQNAFPTLEKYIDHVHIVNGKPAKVPETLQKIILNKFKELMNLHKKGINLFFTDIDGIKEKLKNC